MADDEATITDSDIVLMMATQDSGGLRLLIERYGGRLRAFLNKRFGGVLQEGELAEALNVAFYNIWRFADRYDESKGTLASWCIRVAQNAAKDIIRRETKYRDKNLEYDPNYDPADPHEGDATGPANDAEDAKLDHLCHAIQKLPPLQKAILEADLAAGGSADAGRLAEVHGTSINSIYVCRPCLWVTYAVRVRGVRNLITRGSRIAPLRCSGKVPLGRANGNPPYNPRVGRSERLRDSPRNASAGAATGTSKAPSRRVSPAPDRTPHAAKPLRKLAIETTTPRRLCPGVVR